MARPTKWRKIEHVPVIPYFVPSEKEVEELPENILKLEELEAIRLKDLEGLEQGECAERMEVSRPTFQRILLSAREKVADSLIYGKMIRIEGGNFTRNICPIICKDCGALINDITCYKDGVIPSTKAGYALHLNYENICTKEWFQKGIEKLVKIIEQGKCAIMCSEENPEKCHRDLIIGKRLKELGYKVNNIRTKESNKEQLGLF